MLKMRTCVAALALLSVAAAPETDWYGIYLKTGVCTRLRDPHQLFHSPQDYIDGLRREGQWATTEITRNTNGEIETVDVRKRDRKDMYVRFFASREYCETERADLIEKGEMQKSPDELK